MKRKTLYGSLRFGIVILYAFAATGCAFTVVRPAPLVVGSEETHDLHVIEYPRYILTHDTGSSWDAHVIKDNLFGLTEGEIIHWVDRGLDLVTPGPRNRPVETGIEWIKNGYAQLPDCAPVRIVDGLFSAIGPEKTTVLRGAEMAVSPAAATSYLGITRIIYLTDWVQETLGELNTAGGYLVPWSGPLIPYAVTKPINRCVDSAQIGAITFYIYIVNKINYGIDLTIDGCEATWGVFLGIFIRK